MKGIRENEKTESQERDTNLMFGGTATSFVHHGCTQRLRRGEKWIGEEDEREVMK